jgi:hypothetical protein
MKRFLVIVVSLLLMATGAVLLGIGLGTGLEFLLDLICGKAGR